LKYFRKSVRSGRCKADLNRLMEAKSSDLNLAIHGSITRTEKKYCL